MIKFLKLFLGLMYIVDGICLTLTFGNFKPGSAWWWSKKIAMARLNEILKEK